jgi:hypothetical protein
MSEFDDLERTVPQYTVRRVAFTRQQLAVFADWLADDMPLHDAAVMARAPGRGHEMLSTLKRDLGRQAL